MGKRSRKQRSPQRAAAKPAAPAREQTAGPRPSRGERKDAEARAALTPLEEGERPLAVTIGAVVALLLGLSNVILYAAGVEVGGQKPTVSGIAGPTLIMFVAAYGMFRRKYWAVLGVEALLGIIIVFFSLLAMRAENVKSVAIALGVVVPSGVLFWFLIKAMARIQMPERPRSLQ